MCMYHTHLSSVLRGTVLVVYVCMCVCVSHRPIPDHVMILTVMAGYIHTCSVVGFVAKSTDQGE